MDTPPPDHQSGNKVLGVLEQERLHQARLWAIDTSQWTNPIPKGRLNINTLEVLRPPSAPDVLCFPIDISKGSASAAGKTPRIYSSRRLTVSDVGATPQQQAQVNDGVVTAELVRDDVASSPLLSLLARRKTPSSSSRLLE